jgi:hypothetical protein
MVTWFPVTIRVFMVKLQTKNLVTLSLYSSVSRLPFTKQCLFLTCTVFFLKMVPVPSSESGTAALQITTFSHYTLKDRLLNDIVTVLREVFLSFSPSALKTT